MQVNGEALFYSKKLVSYAQHLEDIILFGYFHDKAGPGFYVDIGANHPKHDSVTKFFSLRGWHGINIEPQESLCKLLELDRPNDVNICVGVSDKPGMAILRQYESNGLSTFSPALQKGYANQETGNQAAYHDVKLKLKPLSTILEKNAKNKQIDFMKVDVEGFEYNALKGNDWKKFRPSVLCIEATGSDRRWQKIVSDAGYQLHLKDGLNEYYVAKESSELIDNYHAFVASEVIRYDVAELEVMVLRQKVRSTVKRVINLIR